MGLQTGARLGAYAQVILLMRVLLVKPLSSWPWADSAILHSSTSLTVVVAASHGVSVMVCKKVLHPDPPNNLKIKLSFMVPHRSSSDNLGSSSYLFQLLSPDLDPGFNLCLLVARDPSDWTVTNYNINLLWPAFLAGLDSDPILFCLRQ